jgi:hypothetical protein
MASDETIPGPDPEEPETGSDDEVRAPGLSDPPIDPAAALDAAEERILGPPGTRSGLDHPEAPGVEPDDDAGDEENGEPVPDEPPS